MRVDLSAGVVRVTLSERNLVALLVKLHQPCSKRTISGRYAYHNGELLDEVVLVVRSEPDALHYKGREPAGAMDPATEQYLAAVAGGVGRGSARANGRNGV